MAIQMIDRSRFLKGRPQPPMQRLEVVRNQAARGGPQLLGARDILGQRIVNLLGRKRLPAHAAQSPNRCSTT